MPLTPHIIEKFGGLVLDKDPFEVGLTGSVYNINMDFDRDGRVRSRDGYAAYNTNTLAAAGYAGIFSSRMNSGELLATRLVGGASVHVDQMDVSGHLTDVGNWASDSAVVTATAHIGLPTGNSLMFLATQGSNRTLQKYNGSTIAPSVGKPAFVAPYARGGRLIQGYYLAGADSPSGANGSISTVFFSDENAPETYTATNFLNLTPGDGEGITGIFTYKDKTIVFKQTRMFVFFGETPDDDGLPIFNFRAVTLPSFINNFHALLDRSLVVGDEGIYMSTNEGVWVTDGEKFVKISAAIDPIFTTDNDQAVRQNLAMSASGTPNPMALSWAANRLFGTYVAMDSSVLTMVWDPVSKQWRPWNFPAANGDTIMQFVSLEVNSPTGTAAVKGPTIFFVYSNQTADHNIFKMDRTHTTDAGSAIAWQYISGSSDLGSPGEKRIRFVDMYGSGTVNLHLNGFGGRNNDAAPQSLTKTFDLGSELIPERDRQPLNFRSRMMNFTMEGTAAASIFRVEHRLAPGLVT